MQGPTADEALVVLSELQFESTCLAPPPTFLSQATPMSTCREQQDFTADEALDELEDLQSEGTQEASMRISPQLQPGVPCQTM